MLAKPTVPRWLAISWLIFEGSPKVKRTLLPRKLKQLEKSRNWKLGRVVPICQYLLALKGGLAQKACAFLDHLNSRLNDWLLYCRTMSFCSTLIEKSETNGIRVKLVAWVQTVPQSFPGNSSNWGIGCPPLLRATKAFPIAWQSRDLVDLLPS
jgi:hypothetical protein